MRASLETCDNSPLGVTGRLVRQAWQMYPHNWTSTAMYSRRLPIGSDRSRERSAAWDSGEVLKSKLRKLLERTT